MTQKGSINVPAAMRQFNQWIVWKLVQFPGEPKPRKLPIEPLSGNAASSVDPSSWSSYDIACAVFLTGGYDGIGFVFSSSDPFFFLDLDGCRTGDEWNSGAFQVVNYLAGSSVEISQSGTGLHVVGYCRKAELADRRNVFRVDGVGKVEFYITGRFMAVGFGNWNADPTLDLTEHLKGFIPIREAGTSVDAAGWNGPRAGYTGPTDDETLIAMMLASSDRSANAMFGGKATLRQLWQADAVALGASWPDSAGQAGRAFDHSSADASLMQHLAFWTGADGERMQRLFGSSALGQRDKWKERGDYRARTINGAISKCSKIYDVVKTVTPGHVTMPGADASGQIVPVELSSVILTPQEQQTYFAECVFITSRGEILTPRNQYLNSTQFNGEYGGKIFLLDQDGKNTDEPWKAATRGRSFKVPVAQDVAFRPDRPSREMSVDDLGRTVINSFLKPNIKTTNGDVTRFFNHMALLFPDDRDRTIILSYMAACVQYPGKKFQWCPVVQGVKGNGKTFFMSAVGYAVGERYVHPVNAEELGANGVKFNSWLFGKLLIIVEEIFVRDRHHILESLKPLITNTRLEFQGKGKDQFAGDNRANFIMATNHKDAVPVDEEERRYAIFYTRQQSAEDLVRDGFLLSIGTGDDPADGAPTEYMRRLWDWFNDEGGKEAVAGWLASWTIPDEFNPATVLHRAPRTSAWKEARQRSRSPAEELIREEAASDTPGFRGGYVSSWAFQQALERAKIKLPGRSFLDVLSKAGYVLHPRLPDGRSRVALFTENQTKPRIYILRNHPEIMSDYPENSYKIAQGYG